MSHPEQGILRLRSGSARGWGEARNRQGTRLLRVSSTLSDCGWSAATAAGNDRLTAVGQWIRRAGQADLARLRAPWDPMAGRYRAPDEKTIRVMLDWLDPRALARALLGARPGSRPDDGSGRPRPDCRGSAQGAWQRDDGQGR